MGMFAGGIKFPTIENSGVSAPIAAPAAVAPPMAYAPRKRSFADNLGLLADAFQGTNRNGQLLAAQEARDFELWNRDALYQRKRADDITDWQAQQQWKIDHPETVNNDTVNDYNFILQTRGKDAADRYLDNLSDPFVNTTLPGDRFYSGPRSGLSAAVGAAGNTAPAAPVGKLTPITGGAAPQAGRPFPLRPLTR